MLASSAGSAFSEAGSRSIDKPLPPIPQRDTNDYSTLEVDRRPRWFEADPTSAPEARVWRRSQHEKINDHQDEGKIHYPKNNEKILDPNENGKVPYVGVEEKIALEDDIPAEAVTTAMYGLRPRTFWILVVVVVFVVVAAAVGGGVGGWLANRDWSPATARSPTNGTDIAPRNKTSPVLAGSGLAALHYVDFTNVTHYRVYFQNREGIIQESASNDNSSNWTVSDITTPSVDVQLGTSLACAAGLPHAMTNYTMVKNVYYAGTAGKLYERQAPINESGQTSAWADNNFSGLYNAANDSYLAAYWVQDLDYANQTLNVLWQASNAGVGLTMGQYTSDLNGSYPWIFTNLNYSVPDGSAFALSPYHAENYLQVFTSSTDSKIQQSVYYAVNHSLIDETTTNFDLPLRTPIAAMNQDNTPLYTWGERPQCAWLAPKTQLFVYASPLHDALKAVSWNCSSGFVNLTSSLSQVLKPGREYLALASHPGARLYVMFDAGDGPEIEQWTVPPFSGQTWDPNAVQKVTVKNVA